MSKSIAIKYSGWADIISVKVDDVCDHAGAEEQVLDISISHDDTRPMMCMVCRCGAYDVGLAEEDEDGVSTYYEGNWQDEIT